MNRLVLRLLNAPALVLIGALGVAVQTSLFAVSPLTYFQPDILLLIVIWCALHRDFTEGGILTLILANVAEIHSAAPQGLFYISYMVVYLGVRGISHLLVLPENPSSLWLLTACASLAWKISNLTVLDLLGGSAHPWRVTAIYLIPGTFVQAVLGPWVYRRLALFDRKTFKDERAESQLDDELQLGEG
jgi:hypothetical protein